MNKKNPWENIKTPESDLNVRLVKDSKSLPLYWGKDCAGHCVFIIELEGDHSDQFNKNTVAVHGIKSDLRAFDEGGKQRLVISLEKHIDQDLFFSLCETLVNAIEDVSDPTVGVSVVLSQIKRWKAFMAGKKGRVLSAEEIRGLFSELMFFMKMLDQNFSDMDVCEAWQGPETSHQDYIFSNTAVEIKSLSGRERNAVRISSEDQLEGVNDKLFLNVFRLVDMPDSDKARSLNDAVRAVEARLKDSEAIEVFAEKIAKAGYVELRTYDKPEFIVAQEKTFKIEDQFPRLIRSQLPDGVLRVSYDIKLEDIEQFECDSGIIWSK